MSVDFELGETSRRSSAVSNSSGGRPKEHEERIVQNAIIQTIGPFSSHEYSHLTRNNLVNR